MKKNATLWNSIPILIAAVIAVVAFTRGTRSTVLLILVFALWGLWAIWTQVLPARRRAHVRQQTEQTAAPDQTLLQTLLHHVNYRVSGCLKSAYPEAHWEWTMRDPASFVATGGTGRIRVYGIPDYSYADVTLDRNGKLSCSLIQVAPINGASEKPAEKPAAAPDQEPQDPCIWYEIHGRAVLESLVADLASRGHHSLTLKEDGNICIRPVDGGTETAQGAFATFPEKVYWPRLVEVLKQNGLAATAKDTGIVVAW